jgi:hypothetical protein
MTAIAGDYFPDITLCQKDRSTTPANLIAQLGDQPLYLVAFHLPKHKISIHRIASFCLKHKMAWFPDDDKGCPQCAKEKGSQI